MKWIFVFALLISGCIDQEAGKSVPRNDERVAKLSYNCKVKGKVIKVVDGDTAYVLDAAKVQHKIRFKGIDAPERSQAFGKVSKQFVSDLIFGKPVCVDFEKRDGWGRVIGSIVIDGKLVNLEVVKAGLAWHYKEYQKEQTSMERKLFAEAEERAKQTGAGLWGGKLPVTPWDYRKAKRKKN